MKFTRIQAGEFIMGNGAAPPKTRDEWLTRDYDESPAHRVKITKAFHLGVHEVTNKQFEEFDPAHKSFRGKQGVSKTDDEPVTYVTWQQASAFCQWLAKKENRPYRLPTEAEWEYCCRAGSTTTYSAGDRLTIEHANLGSTTTKKAGSYKPNAWGLYDMHGNVAEWCLDWYGPYGAKEETDPVGSIDGYARVCRGWSFAPTSKRPWENARYCRSSNRSGHLPEDANRYTGFRVALGELPMSKPLAMELSAYQKDVKQDTSPAEPPDPKKPYFTDFVAEKKNATIPPNTFGPIFSNHNHFTACCVCPNGDVLAAWYSTVTEDGREVAQAATRLRIGADRWDPASLFFDVPDVNDHAPVLLTSGKRIFHFCTQSLTGWDYASDIVRHSDDNGVTWSKPTIMIGRDGPNALSQPCSAIVAEDGSIIVACDGDDHKDEYLIRSTDGGKNWKVAKGDMRKAMGGKYVIHPTLFQRKDGALMTYLRGPDPMPKLVSKDFGDSWEITHATFPGISSGMKAATLKLQSGALLLVSVNTRKKLGRGVTFVALSLDDGATWPHVREVENVGGYMSLAQSPNGVIHLIGSRLAAAAFNEAWLREGSAWK
jgi:formylglycine-generating enzyme required for sulfatase activity